MLKTLIAVALLCLAVVYLPIFVQIAMFAVAVVFVRYQLLLLVPAFFADAWYSPVRAVSFGNNKMTLIVIGMIVFYYIVMRMTRIRERYGLETK